MNDPFNTKPAIITFIVICNKVQLATQSEVSLERVLLIFVDDYGLILMMMELMMVMLELMTLVELTPGVMME